MMSVTEHRLFGSNGVRFIPGVSHDLDFAIRLGEAIGTYYGEGTLLLGQDGRLSSPALANAVISGLMSSGMNVVEAGLVPTPALQYASKAMGFRGGVMITASHNPAKYNGVKVNGPNGIEVPRLDEQRIEKIFFEGSQRKADWRTVGTTRQDTSVVERYIAEVLSKINRNSVSDRKFSVVLDLGNGAQCVAAPYAIEALGCKVITINGVVDGTFPGRGPEPTPDVLSDLSAAVKATEANLGVAYDGDGDRAIFCDEQGVALWGDQTGCLLADYIFERHPGGFMVTPASSTQAVEVIARRRNATVYRTRVGSTEVSRIMIERNAFFGFEENGGCLYSPHLTVRDGLMTTALMLECLAARGVALSKALAFSVPKFFQAKTKVEVEREKMESVMKKIETDVKGKTERIDGLKVWTDEHSWSLIRPSGTEPLIRVFSESDTQDRANQLQRKFVKMVKTASGSRS